VKKISIFAPVLNEEENILIFYQSIVNELKKIDIKDYEIILTDNDSIDNTENIIKEICKIDEKVKYIRFKKNIGYDLSLFLGMFHCSGDYAISTHSDLQDPTKYIKELIEKCAQGKDLVFSKVYRNYESFYLKKMRLFFYLFLKIFCLGRKIPPTYGIDFRIISKDLLNEIKKNKIIPNYRLATFFLSKHTDFIEYKRENRLRGVSKFKIYNCFKYATALYFILISNKKIFIKDYLDSIKYKINL
jgi:polyisoprenyl-phosphate glycosyltransferase